MRTQNSTISLVERIDIVDFRRRTENEALARTLYYDDFDSGRFPHLQREWTLAPWHVRQLYRSLAERIDKLEPEPEPTMLERLFAVGRRFVGGHA